MSIGQIFAILIIMFVITTPFLILFAPEIRAYLLKKKCVECKRWADYQMHKYDIIHADWCITGARWKFECDINREINREMIKEM